VKGSFSPRGEDALNALNLAIAAVYAETPDAVVRQGGAGPNRESALEKTGRFI
jgi:hypothetical protein